MSALHVFFGSHHNWILVALALALLTGGLTVVTFVRERRRRTL